ncbi:MAG TPA: NERD domain-containing protein, partial [Pseudonocardiaceae bacterium]|nr:NERD domain-containing protein [Pseudonocardiaceae bacterium]
MRTVDPAWQNLAAGQRRARQLEIELRERWSARVEEAYHRAFERETAAWNEQRDAERHRYERALNGWHADRQREIKAGLIARDRAAIAERRQLARLLLLGFVVVLGGFLVPLMLSTPTMVATMVAVALLPLAFRLAAKSRARLRALREEDPSIPHGNQPKPQPRSCGSEPKKMARSPVSLDIVQRWWAEVSSTSTTAQGQVTYGDEGVEDFLCLLRHRLGDRYLVVRELPVARSLDVDMLVVGPTGVWVFEVKHWSGTIICRDGRWSR